MTESDPRPHAEETATEEPEAVEPETGPEDLPIDFTTLLLSLSTSAVAHLEEARANPGDALRSLTLARQTIDLVALLEQKTAGNLTGEEERLIGQVLYELRLHFVAQTSP